MVKDTTTGKLEASPTTLDGLVGSTPFMFTVGAGGQSTFGIAYDVVTSSVIKVLVNGSQVVEGPSDDYYRDNSTNSVVFNYVVPVGATVRVEIV